jgi:hypothetical protein
MKYRGAGVCGLTPWCEPRRIAIRRRQTMDEALQHSHDVPPNGRPARPTALYTHSCATIFHHGS